MSDGRKFDQQTQQALERELNFVLSHPQSTLSPMNLRLLTFLGRDGDVECTQEAIAENVLGLGADFQPDADAHARIAVSRLRKALSSFYETYGAFRAMRLVIPKGCYRIDIRRNDPILGAEIAAKNTTPAFAWTLTEDRNEEVPAWGHKLEKELILQFSQSALVHDGALKADRLPESSPERALARCRETGLPLHAHIRITGNSARLLVINARDGAILAKRLFSEMTENSLAMSAQDIVASLTDPLRSEIPYILAKQQPTSRLALAMTFFRFMATQNRRLLPSSLSAFSDARNSSFSSPLIDALHIDARRASYGFATDENIILHEGLVESATRVFERDPMQPYAWLSLAYIINAVGADLADTTDFSILAGAQVFGSPADDLNFLCSLSPNTPLQMLSGKSQRMTEGGSFILRAANIVQAMKGNDKDELRRLISEPEPADSFWLPIFQCAIAAELGQKTLAEEVYGRLKADLPEVGDFAGRAVVTMIPDSDIHERLLFELNQLR